MTLVAREPNTGRRAPPYNGTRDKETRVGLPPAVRDRSRLIVCLFDGRTKALRDKTSLSLFFSSSSPPLLSFALSFLSKEEREEEEKEEEKEERYRKGSVSFESSLRATGGRIKMPRIVYCSPTRASRCVISTVN